MKLKKKVKRNLTIIIVVILLIICGIAGYKFYKGLNKEDKKEEVKVISKIDKYGYNLKENKTKKYKTMFEELKKILDEDEVDEEAYVKKISEMFIYDFYSLDDKSAKTDVGGIDFVYKDVLDNFLLNAQDTYYKYLESNIYNNRTQKLPVVDEITISDIEKKEFKYGDKTDANAYALKATWTYTSEDFSKYQNEATLIFIHDDIKLSLVELD